MPSLLEELYGDDANPATGSAVIGTVSRKEPPSAWQRFVSTPVAQGLREAVMAPIQAGVQSPIGEYLMRMQGVDPQTAKVAADAAREEFARREEGALLRSREIYGGAPGYELSRSAARTAPVAAASAMTGGAPSGFLRMLGTGTAEGAAGGFLEPVTNEADLRNFWATKAKQTGAGAVGGAIGSATGYGLGKAVEKGAGVMAGKLRPAAQEAEELGKKWGVRLSAGDVTGSPLMQKTEVALESLPVGQASFRKGQGKELLNAATTYKNRLVKEMESMGWDDLNTIKAQAASGNARANDVLRQIANAGDDWQKILQTSGNAKLVKNKAVADELYNQVGKLAGDAPVPLNSAMKALQDVKAELSSAAMPDQATLKLVSDLESRLANAAESGVDVSYTGLGGLRSDLGDMVDDYYKGANAAVGGKGAGVLQKIKKAVESDMDSFAANNPGTKDAFKAANDHYRMNVVPFKDAALAKALKDAPADTVYGKFVKASTTPMQAEKFFSALDSKGQSAIRVGMINEALEKATKEVATESGAAFSPAKFAKTLEDLRGSRSVAFTGQEKFELDGLIKLMRHAERAGQFAENPPTGARVIPWLIGGGAYFDPQAMLAGLASAKGLQTLFTSKAGKRLLLSASMSTPGSRAFDTAMRKTLPGVMGAMGGGMTTADPQQAPQQTGGGLLDELYGGR